MFHNGNQTATSQRTMISKPVRLFKCERIWLYKFLRKIIKDLNKQCCNPKAFTTAPGYDFKSHWHISLPPTSKEWKVRCHVGIYIKKSHNQARTSEIPVTDEERDQPSHGTEHVKQKCFRLWRRKWVTLKFITATCCFGDESKAEKAFYNGCHFNHISVL